MQTVGIQHILHRHYSALYGVKKEVTRKRRITSKKGKI